MLVQKGFIKNPMFTSLDIVNTTLITNDKSFKAIYIYWMIFTAECDLCCHDAFLPAHVMGTLLHDVCELRIYEGKAGSLVVRI